jgi:hypothetical protein
MSLVRPEESRARAASAPSAAPPTHEITRIRARPHPLTVLVARTSPHGTQDRRAGLHWRPLASHQHLLGAANARHHPHTCWAAPAQCWCAHLTARAAGSSGGTALASIGIPSAPPIRRADCIVSMAIRTARVSGPPTQHPPWTCGINQARRAAHRLPAARTRRSWARQRSAQTRDTGQDALSLCPTRVYAIDDRLPAWGRRFHRKAHRAQRPPFFVY